MQAKKTRQFNFLLNEHWKRKRRFKLEKSQVELPVASLESQVATSGQSQVDVLRSDDESFYANWWQRRRRRHRLAGHTSSQMVEQHQHHQQQQWQSIEQSKAGHETNHRNCNGNRSRLQRQLESENRIGGQNLPTMTQLTSLIHREHRSSPSVAPSLRRRRRRHRSRPTSATSVTLDGLCWLPLLLLAASALFLSAPPAQATQIPSADPRPTIYSGQVSFGLLLSAHSSTGSELSTAASISTSSLVDNENSDSATTLTATYATATATTTNTTSDFLTTITTKTPETGARPKRQIFERAGSRGNVYSGARPQQQQSVAKSSPGSTATNTETQATCGLVNSNSLYAGMSAIWASHQANLVGDSHLAIGTYVYDSCNDLDVGQRQAVRIVSNLNAFQQTTCESPRGSPISLTIAHGDNQLRAIQLLTSFKVPVITTKEHFALEDYNQLKGDQKKFLFSTAHSSRHLALGSLKFTKRIVTRSTSSPKLLNQFYKMSSRNGLIVISRNLPARFISYLTTLIPNHVNYEMLESSQPIDQIKSVEAIESILIKQTTTSGSSSSTSGSASESRLEPKVAKMESLHRETRQILAALNSDDSDSMPEGGSTGGSDFDVAGEGEQQKMLSPTILMFITPSEAIDLITRLRNDLAEVSRYYSLIVSTREDISPALKTIFHRGGSRLCSGKAFYTISPKPDDINEFSRYFRDTVQMEGETSDHPLICEFAKYQSTSKLSADLDDVSTEPVIKAVWAAAAAFKSVYRRECSALASGSSSESIAAGGASRSISSRQSSSTTSSTTSNPNGSKQQSHPDCMVKMNKVMSSLVQRALKRMDVTINSTGLQAFDGFRIKFDDLNELMTNKFSIKYINKECEITEVGQFSGFKESQLRIDDDLLIKSLESTLPEQWPPSPVPPPVTPAAAQPAVSPASSTSGSSTSSSPTSAGSTPSDSSASSDGLGGGDSNSLSGGDSTDNSSEVSETPKTRRGQKSVQSQDSDSDSSSSKPDSGEGDENGGDSDNDSPSSSSSSSRNRKRSRNLAAGELVDQSGNSRLARRNQNQRNQLLGTPAVSLMPSGKIMSLSRPQMVAAPVTAMGGRGLVPGVTDTTEYATTGSEASTSVAGKPMRKLKFFPTTSGAPVKEWAPTTRVSSDVSSGAASTPPTAATTSSNVIPGRGNLSPVPTTRQTLESELVDSTTSSSMKTSATTQAPVYTTLPESDGNADLEPTSRTTELPGQRQRSSSSSSKGTRSTLDAAASSAISTEAPIPTRDYATSSSIVAQNVYNNQRQDNSGQPRNGFSIEGSSTLTLEPPEQAVRFNYMRDINSSPVPLSPTSQSIGPAESSNFITSDKLRLAEGGHIKADPAKASRSKMRSQLKWIYSSWFALSILGANICGALLTLYVLTFLLMKNCDGSLDRDNQGIRSMHLLSIIVVFFGSTLFIIYPTPGLCLLRTSWHNFALVLLFGSLLLQTMQTRSLNSIGLGGRPNRLNQFLTLVFMVGVQVSFELQRWKYESSSYINFVNQYFGSTEGSDKKLSVLSSSISNQFNPLNSFNDQVTPVSIQVSERYQNLLQDYCTQHTDDFVQSQFYLFMIVVLLLIFSLTTRRSRSGRNSPNGMSVATGHHHHHHQQVVTSSNQTHQKLAAALGVSSGKLSNNANHNHDTSGHHFKFSSNVTNAHENANNLFVVSLIISCLYFGSVFLHTYGQNYSQAASTNHDLIFSVTMVSVAFVTLIGIFMPILRQVHRYEDLMADPISGTILRPVITQSKLHEGIMDANNNNNSPNSHSAFAMFPEFAHTGHRRPSSMSDGSGTSSGAGSRRPFAETKESRRNMAGALANLGLTNAAGDIDPALLNLKLNVGANESNLSPIADELFKSGQLELPVSADCLQQQLAGRRTTSTGVGGGGGGEKRLIMLDVDPCCPRHGHGAGLNSANPMNQSNKCHTNSNSNNTNNNKRNSYVSTSSSTMARQHHNHNHSGHSHGLSHSHSHHHHQQ